MKTGAVFHEPREENFPLRGPLKHHICSNQETAAGTATGNTNQNKWKKTHFSFVFFFPKLRIKVKSDISGQKVVPQQSPGLKPSRFPRYVLPPVGADELRAPCRGIPGMSRTFRVGGRAPCQQAPVFRNLSNLHKCSVTQERLRQQRETRQVGYLTHTEPTVNAILTPVMNCPS